MILTSALESEKGDKNKQEMPKKDVHELKGIIARQQPSNLMLKEKREDFNSSLTRNYISESFSQDLLFGNRYVRYLP